MSTENPLLANAQIEATNTPVDLGTVETPWGTFKKYREL